MAKRISKLATPKRVAIPHATNPQNRRLANYKPLLFTTTMRNPERLKDFLSILFQYNGEILTDSVIDDVVLELIKKGQYKPMKASSEVKNLWKNDLELSDEMALEVFRNNPQKHKEYGFEEGWPSRFDTWYKIAKELGFVYYWMDEKIRFSESGKLLLDKEKPENEVFVFANAFSKYQRNNPYRKILNDNIPLILLIKVIELLNSDKDYNSTGISRVEIPLLLCWRDSDAQALYYKIKELRTSYGYNISDEVILENCAELLENNGKVTKMDNNSILVDYPDDFIRKMRLTSLFTMRGGGRFIDINKNELATVEYIKNKYSTYPTFLSESDFFDYIGNIDVDLINKLTIYQTPNRSSKNDLSKWVSYYGWDSIKNEMINLAEKKSSHDDILKVISAPLRLEFLTSLALLSKLPNLSVNPNFVTDDEGLPTCFASGGIADIECEENSNLILVEVTLLTGTQQHIRESYSVQRHLEDQINKGKSAFSLFISPKTFIDTCRNSAFIKHQYNLDVKILDIHLFVDQLENHNNLFEVATTRTSCV
jgi:hypothetical protein